MKITIITATYNSESSLDACIKSVINQTYFDDIEYIIIDNCSVDSTLDIAKSYSEHISCIVSEPDKGIFDAMNKGIDLASGDVIGFLHSDDIYANDSIIEQVMSRFLELDCDVVYGDLQYVAKGKKQKVIRDWKAGNFSINKFRRGWMPPHPTFFAKKKSYLKCGLYNTEYKIAADYELMLRFLYMHKLVCSYINNVLVKMQIGGTSNRNINNIINKSKEDLLIIKSMNLGSYLTLIFKNIRKIKQFF